MVDQKIGITINLDKRRKNGLPTVEHTPKNKGSYTTGNPLKLRVSIIENGTKTEIIGADLAFPQTSTVVKRRSYF